MEAKEAKYPYKKEIDTKSVKITKEAHKKLKIHAAKNEVNITEFVSNAILKELSK